SGRHAGTHTPGKQGVHDTDHGSAGKEKPAAPALTASVVAAGLPRRIPGLFSLDPFVNFFTVHGNVLGGINANPDLIALYAQHRNRHTIANHDGFANTAGNNQHTLAPCCVSITQSLPSFVASSPAQAPDDTAPLGLLSPGCQRESSRSKAKARCNAWTPASNWLS